MGKKSGNARSIVKPTKQSVVYMSKSKCITVSTCKAEGEWERIGTVIATP